MSNNPFLDAALAAADRGWRVFPIGSGGKRPAFERWQQLATTDHQQLRSWWRATDRWNVGIATGESGLLVVDLDPAHGATAPEPFKGAQHGSDVLAMLAAAAGAEPPADTYTVTTPSGGQHLYFRAPGGGAHRTTTGTLGWRVDTRGRGGCIVGAGSRSAAGSYDLALDHPVAEPPDWLVHALTPPPPPTPAPPLQLSTDRASRYVQAIVASVTANVESAQSGYRHDAVLRAARTFGQLVSAGELDASDAREQLLRAAAVHVGVDGWTAREGERTIDDGLAYGMRLPRSISSAAGPALPDAHESVGR
ncbi:bifunctional DNA primase/polymerase [Jiangella alkaliphila]|uniref:Bifunctional DNA primase/polymerase, N-terminal n=1 Tax=Jiangella alkaliphila TaxID=419479 RepID=A0A1H2L7T6_9ACTN|nr:bifunctional DNA primase/polymerase [Jiangella alkaliphila]SDU76989.1 Bifunctional DNA primase/polymerase, N-terminal [Jiangella alkaliphila]